MFTSIDVYALINYTIYRYREADIVHSRVGYPLTPISLTLYPLTPISLSLTPLTPISLSLTPLTPISLM
jgi:hypothetical protein